MIISCKFNSFHELLHYLTAIFHILLEGLDTMFELLFNRFILLLWANALLLNGELQFPQSFLQVIPSRVMIHKYFGGFLLYIFTSHINFG